VFNAVGTPPGEQRRVDLRYVWEVAEEVGKNLDHYIVFVNKSTVPVGTAEKVEKIIQKNLKKKINFDVASNPEFLREGSAIKDFLEPNRIVIGVKSKKAEKILRKVYEPITKRGYPLIITDIKSAEMIKYVSNTFLARDRVGKKPLKYYFNDKFFIFASELKAILKDREVKREIDWGAIDEYLTYQYVPHPKTGFKGIFKLEPAHYLLVNLDGKIKKERYWNLDYSQKLNLSENEWIKAIEEKLKESVKIRLISDVPLGVHLSGGIDSSMIVAMMAQEMKEPVKTFSVGFKEKEYDETKYARLVAKRYGTEHHELIVEPNAIEILPKLVYHYEEPYADSSALPTWYLCQVTKKYITVALNGDGGDENFAGYDRYNIFKIYLYLKFIPGKRILGEVSKKFFQLTKLTIFKKAFKFFFLFDKNPVSFYLKLISGFQKEGKQELYIPELKRVIQESSSLSFLEEIFLKAKTHWLDGILYFDINTYLPDDLLVKVDIASMAHSLEVRSPFLDHEFIELCAKIPSNLKLKGHTKKYIFKKLAEKYIPKECIYRRKQGFSIPLDYWLRGDLFNFLQENILSQSFLDFGFNKIFLEKLIKEHHEKIQNNGIKLWSLLMLNQWLQTFCK